MSSVAKTEEMFVLPTKKIARQIPAGFFYMIERSTPGQHWRTSYYKPCTWAVS